MDFPFHKGRLFLITSTTVSGIGLAASLLAQLPQTAIVIAGILFCLHIPILGIIWRIKKTSQSPAARAKHPELFSIGFILATSVLCTGTGFLSWIYYFIPGSMIRDGLILVSPALGWATIMAAFLLVVLIMEMNTGSERGFGFSIAAVASAVIGFLFFFWLTAQMFSFTVDDAYITFRYSKNLAAGWGPTYNPGLPPVEGYTTFAWMILMTVPHFFGANVATFSKLVSVLLSSGTFTLASFLTYTLSRTFPIPARLFFGSFAVFLTGMLPITAIHAISGMETSLFTFLIASMVCMVTIGLLEGSPLLFWAPLAGLLLGLTRPEGNLIAATLLIAAWIFSKAPRRRHLVWTSLFLYVLPGGVYFTWRAAYYQLAFPLPFYMKVLHGSGLAGASEIGSYLHYLLPTISVLAVIALLRFRSEFVVVLLPIGLLLTFYLFPVHAMGFDWRFVYPATPLLIVVPAIGGLTLFGFLDQQISTKLPWELVLIGALCLISLGNLTDLENQINNKRFYGTGITNYRTFGTVLSEYNHDHELTLAIGDAGAAPYYSDWQVIDLFGLNNRELAFGSLPIQTLLFEVQPVDLIVLSVGTNRNRVSDEHAGAKWLYEQAVEQGMTRIATFSFGRFNYIWVLGYPDSDITKYIQKHLSINLE